MTLECRTMQPRLFDLGHPDMTPMPPAQRHSDTSVAAAEAIRPHVNRLERIVLEWFAGRGEGATDLECQHALGMEPGTQRARRIALFDKGMIAASGRTAPTATGRQANIWVITEKGRAALQREAPASASPTDERPVS